MSERRLLPSRRYSENFALRFGGRNRTFHVTCGYYDRARAMLGEVFINGGRSGQDDEALARDGAVLISLGLQYGVPLRVMRDAITRNQDASPSTIIGEVLDVLNRLTKNDVT
jgi:hypothetical protein